MQHSSRLNGRRKLSRNEQAASSTTPGSQGSSQINVQGNLSIRRGITRYQQATSHTRNAEPHNISGVKKVREWRQVTVHSSLTDEQTQQSVTPIQQLISRQRPAPPLVTDIDNGSRV